MSRALDDLSSDLKPKAFELLARLVERSIHVLIVDTLRTEAEHQQNLTNGTSWTKLSRHLPRRLRGWHASDINAEKSDAIDLCPYEIFVAGPASDKLGWDATRPEWKIIGEIGESIGLRWGGRWSTPDLGHLEFIAQPPRVQAAVVPQKQGANS